MTLEEILKAVEQLDNAEELREAIIETIETERDRGITATRKKDKDVLKLKATLKDLGYDKKEFDGLDSFVESTRKIKEDSTKSKLTINSLSERVEDLINSLKTEREAKTQIEKQAKSKTLEAELTSAIGDKFYGSKYLIKDIIYSGSVDIDNDGSVFFKQGDNVLSFSKGIETIMDKNKDMLKLSQSGGSGDKGGTTDSTTLMEGSADEVLNQLGL